ncbi:hypothetical protein [Polaromonas sp.]|uniref:hypothetical protein n=1 Tax=Polaromonas sp. TaxID=1869339 RepID=UPI003264C578
MVYNVWETCFFVPGFSQSSCASWAQAWGTFVAVVVTLVLATREQRRIRKSDLAAGKIVIAAVKLVLARSMTKVDELGTDVVLRLNDQAYFPLPVHVGQLREIQWPSQEQLLIVGRVNPDAAVALAQAGVLLASIKEILESMVDQRGIEALPHQSVLFNLRPVVTSTFDLMRTAWEKLLPH